MIRAYPLWIIVLLPWCAALLGLVLTRPAIAWLGARRSVALLHYLGLGASALALIFVAQALPHVLVPDEARALGDLVETPWLRLVQLGALTIDTTLIGDRLAIGASLLIVGASVLVRLFAGGPAGLRELELPELAALAQADDAPADAREPDPIRTKRAMRRLALLGVLEGAALLCVLAGDLVLFAIGWALLGLGAALVVARTLDDERRASLAMRVLGMALLGDLALFAAIVLLVLGGIGASHTQLWLASSGERLFATALTGVPLTEVVALALLVAAGARLAMLTRLGNSIGEALLDAALLAVPAVYLLVRHHRVLALAPTALALLSIVGMIVALLGVGIALVRPGRAQARRRARPIDEQALGGTALAWLGALGLALGVGAWQTAVLLLVAHVLGRLGMRLLLLCAEPGTRLPALTGHVARVLAWALAGLAPSLGFVALARLASEVLARNSLLGPWFGGVAALVVVALAGAHAAALARLWYQREGEPALAPPHHAEDALDFASSALAWLALALLGLLALGQLLGLSQGPTSWLALVLPDAGGHPDVPLQVRETYREGAGIARGVTIGALVLVAVTSGFGWLWARERFRRGDGAELAPWVGRLEGSFAWTRRVLGWLGQGFVGLAELSARGLGRGGFEEGPKLVRTLARDLDSALRHRRLAGADARLGGARLGVLGLAGGLAFVLGWLFVKPSVNTPLPSETHGFGGLAPRLIRAGGSERSGDEPAVPITAEDLRPSNVQPPPLPDRDPQQPRVQR
jgi:NADH:ubiquinone oxidoreductase subunit 5 (subunit L)/multisubunit Na+/H+ antiporter MnhA subunit